MEIQHKHSDRLIAPSPPGKIYETSGHLLLKLPFLCKPQK